MNIASAALWGFVATVVLTTTMAGAQGFGLTRMSIPFLLGTMFTPSRDRAMLYGAVAHMLIGWMFAFLYGYGFEVLGVATWWWGTLAGILHGSFVLAVGMPLMPALHPRMVSEYYGPTANRQLQPPGFFGLHYGRPTPLVTLVAHALFGLVLGTFYSLV
ncbi:MAG: hypothetical protein ACRELD_10330 [Longimicrobiales bacterium]